MRTRIQSSILRSSAALLILAGTAGAQAVPIVVSGDATQTAGNITTLQNVSVNNNGDWLCEVNTTEFFTQDEVGMSSFGELWTEGQALPATGGSLGEFQTLDINSNGDTVFEFELDGSQSGFDSAIYWNTDLILQENDLLNASQLHQDANFAGAFHVENNDSNQVLVSCIYDENLGGFGSPLKDALLVMDLDASGAVTQVNAVLYEDAAVAGAAELFRDISKWCTFNDSASYIAYGILDSSPSVWGVVVHDGTVLARQGSPALAGRNWLDLWASNAINNAGDTAFKGRMDGDSATDRVIIKNGAKFVQEGDSFPAIAPYAIDDLEDGRIFLADNGDLFWYGEWNDPDFDVDQGLFRNNELIVQEGVTMINGSLVDQIYTSDDDDFFVSPNGQFIVFEARLENGERAIYKLDLSGNGGGLGTNYCVGNVNSTGSGATISATGSTSLAANDLLLAASPLPASQPGIFYYGPQQMQAPFGDGTRCVGGVVKRLPVEVTSPAGEMTHAMDNTVVPANGLTAGETAYFQCWYRDPAAGMSGFNLSDGLELDFQP